MKYLHSRFALAGIVVAWPLTQLGGCAQKERNLVPNATGGSSASGGEGGDSSGATGGKGGTGGSKGGTGGKGGSSSGGKGGSSGGSGGSGGKGGSSSGGTGGSTGGKGGSGTGGSGNTNSGGEAGEMVDPTCTPAGPEVCNDGVDNDCDTLTDCLTLVSSFPDENGAAAGAHVELTFSPKHADATFQCRAVKGDVMPAAEPWGDCSRDSGNTAFPIDAADTSTDASDGVWTTQVRLSFPDGGHSRAFERQVYVHSSLNAATRCPENGIDDEDWFAAAAADLPATGEFEQSTVRNPFVEITFSPPIDARYGVLSGEAVVRVHSLRRRFVFDETGQFLLIERNYPSRLGAWQCDAVSKRVHNSRGTWSLGNHTEQHCDAFVMNSQGAGYCLNYDATLDTAVSAEWIRQDGAVQISGGEYAPGADNFAWRKVFTARQISGLNVNFSPACETSGCGTATMLYLPDAALYPYW